MFSLTLNTFIASQRYHAFSDFRSSNTSSINIDRFTVLPNTASIAADSEAKALNGKERLETLYYSLNPFRPNLFVFDWNAMLKAGWDTKDFIAPPSFKFSKQNFEIGDAMGAINCMSILAGELPDTILNDFLELQHLFCVNIHVEPLDQVSALKFVKLKLTGVEEMKINEQKKLQRLDMIRIFFLLQ